MQRTCEAWQALNTKTTCADAARSPSLQHSAFRQVRTHESTERGALCETSIVAVVCCTTCLTPTRQRAGKVNKVQLHLVAMFRPACPSFVFSVHYGNRRPVRFPAL